MPHRLESEYGLTADELLDALERRFRAKITLEGAVAEVQLEKRVRDLTSSQVIERYEVHDLDGYPDFTLWLPGLPEPFRMEVKNVRNSTEAYRQKGQVVGFKVETQKTRTSNEDRSSRFYGVDQFDILAVCLGKKTHNWTQFRFIKTSDFARHGSYDHKLAIMHRVPLPADAHIRPWYDDLADLLLSYKGIT